MISKSYGMNPFHEEAIRSPHESQKASEIPLADSQELWIEMEQVLWKTMKDEKDNIHIINERTLVLEAAFEDIHKEQALLFRKLSTLREDIVQVISHCM